MAQTLVSLLVHITFSTKNRANLITPAIEPELYKYISGTLRNMESPCPKNWRHCKPFTLARFAIQEYRVGFFARGIEEEFVEMD